MHLQGVPATRSLVSRRVKAAAGDLRSLQSMLLSNELDARLLTDFRDALNRIRNVAWAAQQSVASRISGDGHTDVGSLLAAERIRAAYQLCRAIQEDLGKEEIDFQKGQLSELQAVLKELGQRLQQKL